MSCLVLRQPLETEENGDTINVQLRTEFFNVWNHARFGLADKGIASVN